MFKLSIFKVDSSPTDIALSATFETIMSLMIMFDPERSIASPDIFWKREFIIWPSPKSISIASEFTFKTFKFLSF